MAENRQVGSAGDGVYSKALATTSAKWLQSRAGNLGSCVAFDDSRTYYKMLAGGTITMGDIVAAVPSVQAIAATYFGVDAATAPAGGEGGGVGNTVIRLTDDVSGVTANEYEGGYLNITDETGEGQSFRIKSNEATSTDSGGFLVTLYDGLQLALDNTSVGNMVDHLMSGVVTHTAANYGGTPTQFILGRAMPYGGVGSTTQISSGEYLWVQTWGPALCQAGTDTFEQGSRVIPAQDDNGSVEHEENTTAEPDPQLLGTALQAAADGVWGLVYLQIIPPIIP